MSDRARLSASKSFKGQLLASARGDRPPAGSRKALLGAAAALAASAKTVSATATLGTTLVRVAAWKWIAMGAVGLGTVVAAKAAILPTATTVEVSRPLAARTPPSTARPGPGIAPPPSPAISTPAPPPPPSPSSQPPPLPSPSSPPVAMEPASQPMPLAAPKAQRPTQSDQPAAPARKIDDPSRPMGPAPSLMGSALEVEIAAVDQVKAALAGGDTAEALRQIDAYRKAFPTGSLAAEATAVRVEALVRAGRRAEARDELARLRAAHPDSPLLENLGTLTKE